MIALKLAQRVAGQLALGVAQGKRARCIGLALAGGLRQRAGELGRPSEFAEKRN